MPEAVADAALPAPNQTRSSSLGKTGAFEVRPADYLRLQQGGINNQVGSSSTSAAAPCLPFELVKEVMPAGDSPVTVSKTRRALSAAPRAPACAMRIASSATPPRSPCAACFTCIARQPCTHRILAVCQDAAQGAVSAAGSVAAWNGEQQVQLAEWQLPLTLSWAAPARS